MNVDKLLPLISDLKRIEEYKRRGINTFLFALEDFSIGYNIFTLETIKSLDIDVFLFINRLLTDKDIDEFLKLDIPNNVKGFIIEDLGLYEVLKDKGYTLINFQNHLNNNYKTVNYNLKYFDSLVLNNDITLKEIKKIIDNSNKKLCLQLFTRQMIFYSRKPLITNYSRYYNEKVRDILDINIGDNNLIVKENEFGTCIFNKDITDLRFILNKLNNDKIMYYIVDDSLIESTNEFFDMKKIDGTTDGFLYKETIYKVGGK